MAWGNNGDVTYPQDMVSPVGKKLEVTRNAASTTLKTTNSNGGGHALEAEGQLKATSLSDDNPQSTGETPAPL